MKLLNDEIIKYGLHDTTINQINIFEEGLIFIFEKGVYYLNEGKEINLSNKCLMKFSINTFDSKKLYEHITIYQIKRNKIKEIDCLTFINYINASVQAFNIDEDYYSEISKSILLKGYFNNTIIEFSIIDINYIEYLF